MDREGLRATLLEAGAAAVGFASAGPVSEDEDRRLRGWLAAGHHAGMAWMERHADLRRDLDNVLPGTRTVISLAFPYAPERERPSDLPYLSRYAYGTDYHEAIRSLLTAVLEQTGILSSCRLCIDSAPVSERFWAIRAGIGYRGDNGALIVPGIGPEVFLAEILTTIEFEPDIKFKSDREFKSNIESDPDSPSNAEFQHSNAECLHCGACRRACPTGALQPDGTIDCRRCISYLTIEHRGPWTDPDAIAAMRTPAGRTSLFGCDRCITACPLRNDTPRPLRNDTVRPLLNDTVGAESWNPPLPAMLALTPADIPAQQSEFRRRFAHTALLRPGLLNLLRNIANLDNQIK